MFGSTLAKMTTKCILNIVGNYICVYKLIWQELVPVGTRAAPAVTSQLETCVIWREIWPAQVWQGDSQGDSLAPTWLGMFSDLFQNQGEAIQTPLLPYPRLQYPPRQFFKKHQFFIHTTLSKSSILGSFVTQLYTVNQL